MNGLAGGTTEGVTLPGGTTEGKIPVRQSNPEKKTLAIEMLEGETIVVDMTGWRTLAGRWRMQILEQETITDEWTIMILKRQTLAEEWVVRILKRGIVADNCIRKISERKTLAGGQMFLTSIGGHGIRELGMLEGWTLESNIKSFPVIPGNNGDQLPFKVIMLTVINLHRVLQMLNRCLLIPIAVWFLQKPWRLQERL